MPEPKKSLVKNYFEIFKRSLSEFNNDKVVKLSAALAYYTVFSLPPLLIVIIALGSIFYGKEAIQGQIFSQIDHLVGSQAALQIQEVLKKTALNHDTILATIIGIVTLLLGASGIFGEVQDSINYIWGLKAKPKAGLAKMIFNRFISFSMVVILGFILLVSLILNALLGASLQYLKTYFSESIVNKLYIVDHGVMIAVITILFACIFKVLPDAKIKWKDVWVGALVTSILFMVGKFLIGYILERNASISAYGAAGSLIVILLWVYYSSLILYFGAEFTKVHVLYKGKKIEPNKYAVWVEKNMVEKRYNTEVNDSLIPVKE